QERSSGSRLCQIGGPTDLMQSTTDRSGLRESSGWAGFALQNAAGGNFCTDFGISSMFSLRCYSSMLHFPDAGLRGAFRPPAPEPREGRLGLLQLLATLKRNPLECWSSEFFEEPIAIVNLPLIQAVLV